MLMLHSQRSLLMSLRRSCYTYSRVPDHSDTLPSSTVTFLSGISFLLPTKIMLTFSGQNFIASSLHASTALRELWSPTSYTSMTPCAPADRCTFVVGADNSLEPFLPGSVPLSNWHTIWSLIFLSSHSIVLTFWWLCYEVDTYGGGVAVRKNVILLILHTTYLTNNDDFPTLEFPMIRILNR